MTEPLLSIHDMEVSYGAVQVLFGVNLEVHAGEIVSIIGPNGAGKSTVIKAVIGLVEVQGGSVEFVKGGPMSDVLTVVNQLRGIQPGASRTSRCQ